MKKVKEMNKTKYSLSLIIILMMVIVFGIIPIILSLVYILVFIE